MTPRALLHFNATKRRASDTVRSQRLSSERPACEGGSYAVFCRLLPQFRLASLVTRHARPAFCGRYACKRASVAGSNPISIPNFQIAEHADRSLLTLNACRPWVSMSVFHAPHLPWSLGPRHGAQYTLQAVPGAPSIVHRPVDRPCIRILARSNAQPLNQASSPRLRGAP